MLKGKNYKRIFAFFYLFISVFSIVFLFNFNKNEIIDKNALVSDRKRVYNILIAGVDNTGANTDLILLASYDRDSHALSLLQIPRDTAVFKDGRASKINSLYGVERLACTNTSNSKKIASERTFEALSELLCIKPDYYIFSDLSAFRDVVDSIGGISINVPYDMSYTDPEQGLRISLGAGERHLNGEQAEQFVRFRSGYIEGDLGRLDAQKLFFSALIRSALKDVSLPQALSVVKKCAGKIETNMPLAAVTGLLYDIYSNKHLLRTSYMTLPGEAIKYRNSPDSRALWYYVLNRRASFEMLSKYFASEFVDDISLFDAKGKFYILTDEQIVNIYFDDNFGYKIYTEDNLKNINPFGV